MTAAFLDLNTAGQQSGTEDSLQHCLKQGIQYRGDLQELCPRLWLPDDKICQGRTREACSGREASECENGLQSLNIFSSYLVNWGQTRGGCGKTNQDFVGKFYFGNVECEWSVLRWVNKAVKFILVKVKKTNLNSDVYGCIFVSSKEHRSKMI